MIKRKKVSVLILPYLIPSLERVATKNKWDLDAVVEEAFIHYLNEEHMPVPYTRDVKAKKGK